MPVLFTNPRRQVFSCQGQYIMVEERSNQILHIVPTDTVHELNAKCNKYLNLMNLSKEAQWLSGRVLDLRLRGCWFKPHELHCVVSMNKTH